MANMLINGILRDKPAQANGRCERHPSQFRNRIETEETAEFPSGAGRYRFHLFKACPWCRGVDFVLSIKGLRDAVSITWMNPHKSEDGWVTDHNASDPVYVTHFKIDRARIADYPTFSRYLAEVAALSGVADTIDLPHISAHYFKSHGHINPNGIIPIRSMSLYALATPVKGAA